jgi:hypothetical protein
MPPDDRKAVDEFLTLLARAVRQFHTYPPASAFCTDAIAACHKAFASSFDRRERFVVRVTPNELFVDQIGFGAGTVVEQELTRRLHRARVTSLDFDRMVAPRHLAYFCTNLIRCEKLLKAKTTFAELLTDQGVDTIVPSMAPRPEVFAVAPPSAPVYDLVAHEQKRQQSNLAGGGPVDYLYPPDKGWIRLDPSTRLDSVSLADLAVLVNDPTDVATMLLRLTDDDVPGADAGTHALERKFSDVSMLFSSLDQRLARVMFAKLARAVLDLDVNRRNSLLRRTILPGLLDGRPDGTVLHDFPDADLADSLCLLLELETAAPEVLATALNRLDLSPERREAVVPLIDGRLRDGSAHADRARERDIDRFARRLVRVDANTQKDFSEFSAFDLSIDNETEAAIAAARGAVDTIDPAAARLGVVLNLVRLEPNPTTVAALLTPVVLHLDQLERARRWSDLAAWATSFRQLAADLHDSRPDVAEAIATGLAAFNAPARATTIVDLYQTAETRQIAHDLVAAFGVAVVPGFVRLVDHTVEDAKTTAAISLMCEHAARLAPALVPCLEGARPATLRAIVKTLGFAGPAYASTIARQLDHDDEQTSREALRALARIGTAHAAALVAKQLQFGKVARRAAEEALWHMPAARAAVQVHQLLGNRDFVMQNPEVAERLLSRAAHAGTDGLQDVIAGLEPLRFHFWNPRLMRVAAKARELRAR